MCFCGRAVHFIDVIYRCTTDPNFEVLVSELINLSSAETQNHIKALIVNIYFYLPDEEKYYHYEWFYSPPKGIISLLAFEVNFYMYVMCSTVLVLVPTCM